MTKKKTCTAAIIGLLLCIPFGGLFTLLTLNIEPDFGPLAPLLASPGPDRPNVVGSLVALGTFLLVWVAFIINLLPILRTMRLGGKITAHPANLVLVGITLAVILLVIGAIIVDQYPCWIGVPNCD